MSSLYVFASNKAINTLTPSPIPAIASLVGSSRVTTQMKANIHSDFVPLMTHLHKVIPPSVKAKIKQVSLKDKNTDLTTSILRVYSI